MRLAASAVFVSVLFTAACGYVGPVLPPSPQIPPPIADLSAVERGDKIIVAFTTPARTADGVAITKFSSIDLRVSAEQQSAAAAKSYSVPLPSPSDRDDPQPKFMSYSLDVSDFTGQHIAVSVRTSVKKNDHFSDWSKAVILDVIAPLASPVVHAEGSANGIVLTWPASDDAQYLVQRQNPTDKAPIDLATVNEPRYVDTSGQYDTRYIYIVTAKKGSAESLPSEPLTFSAVDIYPPAVPTGITGVAGPDSVDIGWQRNTESDLQGYYVYRSTNNGPYQRQGDLVTLPTYVDHNVAHGNTYSYKISAVDKKANQSSQSNPVEVQY